jgi:hypothetical protein
MKRKSLILFPVVALILGLMVGCAAWQTAQGRTETIVISYESVGMVAFPTVLAYLQQREINGSLSGDALANAKRSYASARTKYIEVGNLIITYVQGSGQPGNIMSQVSVLLRQIAVILADLSGGSVQGNLLTIPSVGGK